MTRRFLTRPRRAFTLIELLVVISIIALLIGILLPALGKARDTSRLAACLSNNRQMSIATASYAADNNAVTPAGHYNNASGISPKSRGAPPGSPLPGGFTVWDSIGGLLENYLGGDAEKVYRCPAAQDTKDDNFQIAGSDPFSGTAADDVFKPNYFYMCTAQWIEQPLGQSWYPQIWSTRNVANLKLGTTSLGESEMVAWVDESTSHHTNTADIYQRYGAGESRQDLSNFGYLDGHAETKSFDDLSGYLGSLSGPIAQTQFGRVFRETAAWAAAETLPTPLP